MKIEPVTLDPRRAGQVTRYHTWPRLREQSVGEHSWQVQRILLAVWPDAPRHLILHCMTHDVGESVSGDPPYPIKALNVDLKKACDRIEREAHWMMAVDWWLPSSVQLSDFEAYVFKLCEFIEMWEWGLFEMDLGNQHAQLVVERCVDGMMAREKALREEFEQNHVLAGILSRVAKYVEKRRAA